MPVMRMRAVFLKEELMAKFIRYIHKCMWVGASESVSKLAEPLKGDTEVQLRNNHVGRGFSRDTRLILYVRNTSGSPLCLSERVAAEAATHRI